MLKDRNKKEREEEQETGKVEMMGDAGWLGVHFLLIVKRYLAYPAEQPFAATFGTEWFLSNHVDSMNMLYASTLAPASVRE